MTCFCAVDRAPDDPQRPPNAGYLEPFWIRRGYRRRNDLKARYRWREIGDADKSEHTLKFWERTL